MDRVEREYESMVAR